MHGSNHSREPATLGYQAFDPCLHCSFALVPEWPILTPDKKRIGAGQPGKEAIVPLPILSSLLHTGQRENGL